MTAKEVLNGAAKRLRAKGWIQGNYGLMAVDVPGEAKARAVKAGTPCGAEGNVLGTPVGATDIIGALRQTGLRYPAAVDEAKAKLRKQLKVDNLADWNDVEGRTVDEVVAALEKAAA